MPAKHKACGTRRWRSRAHAPHGHLRGNAEQCAVPGWLTPSQFEPRSGPARVTETSMLGSSGIET